MEAIGFKKRLEDAKNNSQYVKLVFQYPASDRAIIKRGFVKSIVKSWDDNQKIWMLSGASETYTTIKHKVGSLNPGNTFQVLVGGKEIGSYQANQEGEIKFSHTGYFTGETEVKLINRN